MPTPQPLPESMPAPKGPDLLRGPVGPTLIRLALPMVFGITAVLLFNVVDTIYVGRLGARELAAMSFTFPVTFVALNLVMGIGMGVSSVISRAIGQGDRARVRRLTTDTLALGIALVGALALAGLLTIQPLFRALGASDDLIPLISSYMVPWYLGVGFLVIPMLGNSALRATGDTKRPSLLMIFSGAINILVDPLLIFGLGPFPRLGLQGAAIATVLSWTVTFGAALWLLSREGMLDRSWPRARTVWESWKAVLHVGLPASGTNMLVPVSSAVLTRLIASYGPRTVAGFGAATRVETLAMIGIFALSTAVAPFVGQNFGARRSDRVGEALGFAVRASLLWGLGVALLLGVASRPIAACFNEEPEVVATAARYMTLLPISYGLLGSSILISSMFNAVGLPYRSAFIVFLRLFVLAIPLAYLGAALYDTTGIFIGMSLGNGVIGLAAIGLARKFVAFAEEETTKADAALAEP